MLFTQARETMLQTSSGTLSVLTHFRPGVTTKYDTKNESCRLGDANCHTKTKFHMRTEQPSESTMMGLELNESSHSKEL